MGLQGSRIKHHSTPDKGSQRNFNADDDIFFDMDGLDTRDSNMPEMTQSDDEDGDDDEDFGELERNAIKISSQSTECKYFSHLDIL